MVHKVNMPLSNIHNYQHEHEDNDIHLQACVCGQPLILDQSLLEEYCQHQWAEALTHDYFLHKSHLMWHDQTVGTPAC